MEQLTGGRMVRVGALGEGGDGLDIEFAFVFLCFIFFTLI